MMNQHNPYQAPESTVSDTGSHGSLAEAAKGQKLVIYAILINLLFFGFLLILPVFAPDDTNVNIGSLVALGFGLLVITGSVASLVLSLIGVVRIGAGLGHSVAARVIWVVIMFLPLFNLILMLVLSNRVTKKARTAGLKVGLMGVKNVPQSGSVS